MQTGMKSGVKLGGWFDEIICRDKYGAIKWTDTAKNLVPNVALNLILDRTFTGSAATEIDPWYAGLTGADPVPAAADTLSDAGHAGWTEFTDYTGNRMEYVDVRTDQTVSNTASKAEFPITTAGTVGGAFMASAATRTVGTLLCCAALTGSNRTVADGDTVTLTYTFTAADA